MEYIYIYKPTYTVQRLILCDEIEADIYHSTE